MKTAIVIVGDSYPNILSLIYESHHAGCPIYVVRYGRLFNGIRECYTAMQPEKYSRLISGYHYVGGHGDDVDWDKIKAAIDESIGGICFDHVIVIPTDDLFCMLINKHKSEFPSNYVFNGVGVNGRGDCSELSSKGYQKKLALEAEINVACGCEIKLGVDNPAENYRGPFPCIVKINKSIECYTDTKGIVGRCKDFQELQGALSRARELGLENVVVEELLPIEYELGVTGFSCNGRIVAIGGFRKLLVCTGCRLGNTISGYVLDISKDAMMIEFVEKLQRLMSSVGYNGQFDVDMAFANGRYYMIEINLRIGAFSFSVAAAGLDMLGQYVKSIQGCNFESPAMPVRSGDLALNERAAIEEVGDCTVSLGKYLKLLRKCRVRKIRCNMDMAPYRHFRKLSVIPMVINLSNHIIPISVQKRCNACLRKLRNALKNHCN